MKSPSVPAPPSVQGVRPTPNEVARGILRGLGFVNIDVQGKNTASVEAAVTRDREQGRAADAAEIARLREALEQIGEPVGGRCPNCGERLDDSYENFCGFDSCAGFVARRALAAPLAPATTGTKEK